MRISEICTRTVVQCNRKTTALQLAQLMRNAHVGDVVVVDEGNGGRIPVGIVTDRDLAVAVMAVENDPSMVTAGEIMNSELVTVGEPCDVYETAELMRFKGARRIPVVDEKGRLIGIVTMDDLLRVIGDELTLLGKVISRETSQEQKSRPQPTLQKS
jgi:CBS domain-containing protein